jgi:hypothetical protein
MKLILSDPLGTKNLPISVIPQEFSMIKKRDRVIALKLKDLYTKGRKT